MSGITHAEQRLNKAVENVRARLNKDMPDEFSEVAAALLDGLKAKREAKRPCKRCGVINAFTIEDWTARIKAFDTLMSQTLGRPATREAKPVDRGERTRAELEGMSDDELLALAGD